MCGRYVSVAARADLQQLFGATGPGDGVELSASYNVAPTSKVYAIVERRSDDGGDAFAGGAGRGREVRAVRWGLVPVWSRPRSDSDSGKGKSMPTLHNARADRLATARTWRGPFAKRRAVIPATGYYEWLSTEDADGKPYKQPYYIHPADGLLAFAGLYELWPDPAKDADDPQRWLWSVTIITHHATWLAGVMNERTPVILPPDRIDAWLDPDLTDINAVQELISGIEYEPLQVRAVSTAVNKTGAVRGPQLIQPIDEHGDRPLQLVRA